MGEKVTRRVFMGGAVASAVLAGCKGTGTKKADEEKRLSGKTVIAVAGGGKGPGERVKKAVEALGGMKRFVSRGSVVAVLPNSQKDNPGTFTHPEVLRQAIRLIWDAGARKIVCLSWLPAKYWAATGLGGVLWKEGAELHLVPMKNKRAYAERKISGGRILKKAMIMKECVEADCLINLPIIKHHVGNGFTGCLKNAMGLNLQEMNGFFHARDKEGPAHLDQCIADLNLAVNPVLSIADATEMILTNGPFGPGKVSRPGKVVAGTDRVAIDAYATRFLEKKPGDVLMIKNAASHGIGTMELERAEILEV